MGKYLEIARKARNDHILRRQERVAEIEQTIRRYLPKVLESETVAVGNLTLDLSTFWLKFDPTPDEVEETLRNLGCTPVTTGETEEADGPLADGSGGADKENVSSGLTAWSAEFDEARIRKI